MLYHFQGQVPCQRTLHSMSFTKLSKIDKKSIPRDSRAKRGLSYAKNLGFNDLPFLQLSQNHWITCCLRAEKGCNSHCIFTLYLAPVYPKGGFLAKNSVGKSAPSGGLLATRVSGLLLNSDGHTHGSSSGSTRVFSLLSFLAPPKSGYSR